MTATTCRTCSGEGYVEKQTCRCWSGFTCPHDGDGKIVECPDCAGTGRKWCEVCGDQPALMSEPNEREGKPPHLLCLVCHAEWMAENARTRAENAAMAKIEQLKM